MVKANMLITYLCCVCIKVFIVEPFLLLKLEYVHSKDFKLCYFTIKKLVDFVKYEFSVFVFSLSILVCFYFFFNILSPTGMGYWADSLFTCLF